MEQNPSEGRIVTFTPSERTSKKFKHHKKRTYPAIITEVNEATIDLTVFGVGETVYVAKVAHASVAEENRSRWDWPTKV
jgi:hypothetical protein